MQRPYTKKTETVKEYYELREPATPPQKPTKQDPAPAQQSRQFTIPSSSSMIKSNPPQSTTTLSAYPQDRGAYLTPQQQQQLQQRQQQFFSQQQYSDNIQPRSLHCITIADHIIDCPICSRFYRSYAPVYTIIITILLIVIIVIVIKYVRSSMRAPSAAAAVQPTQGPNISIIPPVALPSSSFHPS